MLNHLPDRLTGEPCVKCPPCARLIPMIVSPGLSIAKIRPDSLVNRNLAARLPPPRHRARKRALSQVAQPHRRTRTPHNPVCRDTLPRTSSCIANPAPPSLQDWRNLPKQSTQYALPAAVPPVESRSILQDRLA